MECRTANANSTLDNNLNEKQKTSPDDMVKGGWGHIEKRLLYLKITLTLLPSCSSPKGSAKAARILAEFLSLGQPWKEIIMPLLQHELPDILSRLALDCRGMERDSVQGNWGAAALAEL